MHPCSLQGDNSSGLKVLEVGESQAEILIRSNDQGDQRIDQRLAAGKAPELSPLQITMGKEEPLTSGGFCFFQSLLITRDVGTVSCHSSAQLASKYLVWATKQDKLTCITF